MSKSDSKRVSDVSDGGGLISGSVGEEERRGGGEEGRSGVPTAAIFAWRLGGMRVAAGAFRFVIFDG